MNSLFSSIENAHRFIEVFELMTLKLGEEQANIFHFPGKQSAKRVVCYPPENL